MESEFTFFDHPSFDPQLYRSGWKYCLHHAKEYGLVEEVLQTFNIELEAAFKGNNYPITLNEYYEYANDALWEWDI